MPGVLKGRWSADRVQRALKVVPRLGQSSDEEDDCIVPNLRDV